MATTETEYNVWDDGTYPGVTGPGVDGLAIWTADPRPRPSKPYGVTGDDAVIDFSDASSGDLLIVAAFIDDDALGTITHATPAGWTKISNGSSSRDIGYAVFTKTAGVSEGTTTFVNPYSGDSPVFGWIIPSALAAYVGSVETTAAADTQPDTQSMKATANPADRVSSVDEWVLYFAIYHSASQFPVPADWGAVGWETLHDARLRKAFSPSDHTIVSTSGLYSLHSSNWSGSSSSVPGQFYDVNSGLLVQNYVATLAGGDYAFGLYEGYFNNPRTDTPDIDIIVDEQNLHDSVAIPIWLNLSGLSTDTVSRFATDVVSIAEAEAEVSRFAIYQVSVPYTSGTSVVSMMVPNPAETAGPDELNETRFPDIPSAVRGVKVDAVTGELARKWSLLVDLGQVLNVSNNPVNPDVAYGYIESLKNRELLVPFQDNGTSVFRDETESVSVMIEEITRLVLDGQQFARVEVVEVPDAN